MIKDSFPLSTVEAIHLMEVAKAENSELKGFSNKFVKEDIKVAKKVRKEIEELGLLKVKAEHIAKLIDLMPDNLEDLNKIFIDVGLDENESNKILNIFKTNK